MRRHAMVMAAVAAALVCTAVDLGACGDKFLKPGKGTRVRHYATIHPAAILVYKSANATADGVKFYQDLLTGAGHTPVFVNHGSSIAQAAAAGKYDLVITMYADAATVKAQLASISAKPDVLPILYKPTKGVAAQAAKEYPFLILPHDMDKYDALHQIDHLMDRRLKGSAVARAAGGN